MSFETEEWLRSEVFWRDARLWSLQARRMASTPGPSAAEVSEVGAGKGGEAASLSLGLRHRLTALASRTDGGPPSPTRRSGTRKERTQPRDSASGDPIKVRGEGGWGGARRRREVRGAELREAEPWKGSCSLQWPHIPGEQGAGEPASLPRSLYSAPFSVLCSVRKHQPFCLTAWSLRTVPPPLLRAGPLHPILHSFASQAGAPGTHRSNIE